MDIVRIVNSDYFLDVELFKYIKPTGQVLEGVRSMVANRLASNGINSYFFTF